MLIEFAASYAALLTAHRVADHWVQRDHEAMRKSEKSIQGHKACLSHVLGVQAVKLFFLVPVMLMGLEVDIIVLTLALVLDGVTHFWADKRYTLEWLARKLKKENLYHMGQHLGKGSYVLDQSFHEFFVFVTALIIAIG